MKTKGSFIFLILLTLSQFAYSQLPSDIFERIEIRIHTSTFNSEDHLIPYNGENHLYFKFEENSPTCEIRLYPSDIDSLKRLKLVRSSDYEVLDSLININNRHFRFRVQFRDLTRSDFLNFTFSYMTSDTLDPRILTIPLLPVTRTEVIFNPDDPELFIGEEKVFPLITSNRQNIRVDRIWTTDEDINYRLSEENGRIYLHVTSDKLGWQILDLRIKTHRPYINEMGELSFELPPITQGFEVKASRLRFLRIDEEEIIYDPTNMEGYEIQLENSPFFALQRTYRVENQEEPGGPLIAEIFTRSYLNNGRILCWFRPFALHRKSDGYLYIKENDVSRFITNVNIIPRTQIEKIELLREGDDWTSNLNVYPGETIDLRINGKSLHRANFRFNGITNVSQDSLLRNENLTSFSLKIPVNIISKEIQIMNNGLNTGYSLKVREYQRPREFDFINLEGNGFRRNVKSSGNTILVNNTLQDILIEFDRDLIDKDRLYGKQIIDIKITIRGKDNELIEIQELEDIVICPGEYSPRSEFYTGNCTIGSISLNSHLSKKTYDLDEWSKVILEIGHDKSKYDGEGISKRVEIIIQKFWRFDIDVSFPAGLITFGGSNSGNLTGISMAMIAQFSFYEKDKINRYRPYKVGAGFIALDAFNFSDNSENRDVAMVILGSLYPTRKDSKLTFPLYFGGGYKLRNQEFFILIGPGIRVRL